MKPEKNGIIITSYVEKDFPMKEQTTADDFIICADGGWDIALKHGLSPDVVIGDLDSVTTPIPSHINVIPFDPVKDFTDLQLAIDTALEAGITHLRIFGGIGGRLDHTIANMQLLEKYRHDFAHLSLEDGANYARMLPEGRENVSTLEPRDGWYFSIFSLSKQCRGVTIKNAAYELEDYTLTRQFPLGVSNEFTKENAAISYDSGALLFVMSRK